MRRCPQIVWIAALMVAVAALSARAQQSPPTPEENSPNGRAARPNLRPLSEMSADDHYRGEDGGLYGGGQNEPPQSHLQAALKAAAEIQPRDRAGRTSPEGKIGVVSIGMSNTAIHWRTVMELAPRTEKLSPQVVLVQGARGGLDAHDWAQPDQRRRKERPDPWQAFDRALERAGLTAAQVQAAWILHARRNPVRLGGFPDHARALQKDLTLIVQRAKQQFPNLRIVYLSNRIYAGYALTNLNPEPYAYESAFALRWLIQDQIAGKPELNFDPERGAVRAPVLLWGPDLWANGDQPRNSDGLQWALGDFVPRDRTHPTPAATREKSAPRIVEFFRTSPTSRDWFTTR